MSSKTGKRSDHFKMIRCDLFLQGCYEQRLDSQGISNAQRSLRHAFLQKERSNLNRIILRKDQEFIDHH